MDGFMDKLAHKLGAAGEAVRSGSEAEARALRESRARAKSLEAGIEEMKRLSLKCAELNELTEQLAKGAIEKIEEIQAQAPASEEGVPATQSADLEAIKNLLDESLGVQRDNFHQESVRVYRNVQASIVDELKQQSEAIAAEHLHMEKKVRGIKPVSIIALVFSGISTLVSAAILLILLGIIPLG